MLAAMPFGSLVLPVLVSAAVVWIASAIAWMVLPHHRSDCKRLPDEESVRRALGPQGAAPAVYGIPHSASMADCKSEAHVAKLKEGPVALVTILPNGPPAMGKSLALWFGLNVLVSFVAAYVARHVLAPGDIGWEAARVTGTVAIAAYALGLLQESIWWSRPWTNTLKSVADGVVYGLLTGATFCFLWPKG